MLAFLLLISVSSLTNPVLILICVIGSIISRSYWHFVLVALIPAVVLTALSPTPISGLLISGYLIASSIWVTIMWLIRRTIRAQE